MACTASSARLGRPPLGCTLSFTLPPKPPLQPSAAAEPISAGCPASLDWLALVDSDYANPVTVCLSCSQNRPLKLGPRSEAQKQTLVMFEGCNCSSGVMFLFSL